MDTRAKPILLSALLGFLAFLLGSIPPLFLIRFTFNYVLGVLISALLSGILLGVFLEPRRILKTSLVSLVSVFVGFLGSFLLVEGIGALLTQVGVDLEGSYVPDVSVIALMGLVLGALFGLMMYGKKSMLSFALICALVCIPAGLLIVSLNLQLPWISWLFDFQQSVGFDMNYLATMLGFGLGLGISIGRQKKSIH